MPRKIPTRRPARTPKRSSSSDASKGPARKPAVLYARVSTKDQEREGYSIPAQQALLKQYAADKGFEILEEFVDVETAKRAGRTSFSQMLKFLKKSRTCRVILVEKTDRLYRNLKDWVSLDDMDLEIHLVKEGLTLSDDSRSGEKFMHGIRVLMAKNYIDNLSEEVKKGMRQKAEEGHWPNPAPIGYLNRRQGGKSTIVPDPDRALLVRRLFELYGAGTHSIASLTEHAASIGLKGRRGGALQRSTVNWILRNPIYAGKFLWDGKVYESKDPTLISWELFERVQATLDGRTSERVDRDLAFTGLMTCGHCGYAITGQIKKEKYIYYHCCKYCTRDKFVREERLVELFAEALQEIRLPPPARALAAEYLKRSRKDIEADAKARMDEARKRYDRASNRIERAYEDMLDGRIEEDFFYKKRAEWEAERDDALAHMGRIERADRSSIDAGIALLETIGGFCDEFLHRNREEQRQALDLLVLNSSLAAGKLSVTFRKPFNFLAELAKAAPPRGTALAGGSSEGRTEWWAILDLNQ